MKLPTDHTVFQNAWVVDDVEAAAMDWVNTFNIGPFFLAEYGQEQLTDIVYRGEPGELNMYVAIAQAGPVQIELIQPISQSPNAYRDTAPAGKTSFHHVCVWTDDLDADLEFYAERGCPTANLGRVIDGPRFAYVDSHAKLNCMLEILERSSMIEGVFKMIADTAENWDGKNPIRGYE